jgi:hypothetical protein
MLTEDVEILERGVWEVEIHGERARERREVGTTHSHELVAKLAQGIAKDLQVQLELPYLREDEAGEIAEGRGDATLSLKWRFYDADRLSLALKPDLILATGRDQEGLGAGRTGWALNAIAGYDLGRLELLGHVAYTRNRNRLGEREHLRHASAALRWAATDKLKLIVDLARETQPEPDRAAARELVLGASYALRQSIDIGVGIKEGLNDAADDRAVRAGIKLRF